MLIETNMLLLSPINNNISTSQLRVRVCPHVRSGSNFWSGSGTGMG